MVARVEAGCGGGSACGWDDVADALEGFGATNDG
jgi:hypothetical protein